MEDQLIIKLFWERSEQALKEASEKYGRLLKALSMRILGNEQDAEECVNDTFLAAWNAIPPEKPDPLSAYFIKITRNQALKKYHRMTAQKRNSCYDAALEEFADLLPYSDTAEDLILAKELSEQINEFLEGEKPEDRKIFVQRYYFCREISEIAKDTKRSEGYVN